jgi:hypothetical protein
MAKQKVGLHKQVSQIFDGVPLPKESCSHERVKTLVSNRLDFLRPTSRESTPAPVFQAPATPVARRGCGRQEDAGADTINLHRPYSCHNASDSLSAGPKQYKITIVIKALKRVCHRIFHPRTTQLKR